MSKALSRALTDLDDATRAAARRAAQRKGKSLGDWIDEAIRLQAQVETPAGDKTGPEASSVSSSLGLEHRVAEISRRLQQRRSAATPDVLAQSLTAAGRRLAEARVRNHDWRQGEDVAALRREILELERMTETANRAQSRVLQRDIDELLALLDDHIEAQRRAGVSEALLAPAQDIAGQLRLAVVNLDPATVIDVLRADLDTIGRRLDEFSGSLRDLAQQVGGLREQVSRLLAEAPLSAKFEAGLVELARHVCALADSGALAQKRHAGELAALSRSITELVSAETNRGITAICDQMTTLVSDFNKALDRASEKNLAEMDARLRTLGESLSQSLSQKFEDGLSRSAADSERLQNLTQTLAQKIDAALAQKNPESADSESERQICGPQLVDLVSRLDAMQAALTQSVTSSEGNRQVDLAQQIEKLALRIDRALDTQNSETTLSGLETQIEKLAARIEAAQGDTLKMAETIARQAGEAVAQATYEKGKATRETAEQKETRETLRAVQEWLARIGERFATVEDVVRQLQDSQFHAPARDAKAPDVADVLLRVERSPAPTPVVEALAIPMAAEALAVDTRATQAGFIAAARRAAQQAARGQWTQETRAPGSGSPAHNTGRSLAGVSAHRRSALIALGAVMLLAGAYQLTQNISFDDTPKMTIAQDATLPKPKEPVQTVVNPRPNSSKQASTVDPAPVGAIVNPRQSGVAATMNSAMALATLAANGDAVAQFELASRYTEGRDIARDSKLAVLWFEKAAQQGLAPAQYRLGTLYEKGLGVERNAAIARDWYQRAADAGNVRAMHNLAVMLAEGGDGKSDYATAAVWFRKAADLGVRDSQYNLAILYARGLGVETSLVQSYFWFSAAAAQGDVDAAKKRDEVAARLGARDLETAKALAAGFQAKTPAPAANDVATPPGGWRAPAPAPAKATTKPKMSWFQSF